MTNKELIAALREGLEMPRGVSDDYPEFERVKDLMDQAAQALEAQEWRTNVDQVPWGKLVLISNKGAIRIAFRSQVNGAWQSEYDYGLEVPTHWKPLDTPPETE